MPFLVASPTELTTAATDVILALIALACADALKRPGPASRRRRLWRWLFLSFAGGALLGAVAHGISLPQPIADLLWPPIYFLLGLTLMLLAGIAMHDWRGEKTARRAFVFLLPLPVLSVIATAVGDGAFIWFVVIEVVVMLFALAVYGLLASRRHPGAASALAGVLISVFAAAVQASGPFFFEVVFRFDHNGLFHLVQVPAVACFYRSARIDGRVV